MSHSLLNLNATITNVSSDRYQRIRLPLVKTTDVKALCAQVFRSLPLEYSKHAALQVKMVGDIAELTLEYTCKPDMPSWVEASFDEEFNARFRTVPLNRVAEDKSVPVLDRPPEWIFLAVPATGLDGKAYGANNRWATIPTADRDGTQPWRCKYLGADGSVLTETCVGDYPTIMVDSWVTGRMTYMHAGEAHIAGDGGVKITPTDYLTRLVEYLGHPDMRLGIGGGGTYNTPNGMVTYSRVNNVMLNGVVIDVK